MSNDEECIRRMTESLRRAIEHERKDPRRAGDAIGAAIGAIFDEPRSVRAADTKARQLPAG